jgi:uncharacterized SAM-binding protein YcdF (DUF218 family)
MISRAGVGWLSVVVAVAASALAVANPDAPGRFLQREDRLEGADAMLVFNGDPNYERTLEAVRLYRAGYARYIVFSGRGGPGDSAQSMAQVATQNGVPPQALLLEEEATSTYEDVLFVRRLVIENHVRRLILVTSPYHQLRAYLVARHLLPGLVLINHPAPSRLWSAHTWWQYPKMRHVVLNEYMKLAGYLLMRRV